MTDAAAGQKRATVKLLRRQHTNARTVETCGLNWFCALCAGAALIGAYSCCAGGSPAEKGVTSVAAAQKTSAAPATSYTPSASPAPKLALDPNIFAVRICASDPCSPSIDSNSGKYSAAFFGNEVTLGALSEMEPGTNGRGPAAEDVVLFTSNSDPEYSVTCTDFHGCGKVAVHIPNGAHADYSAGDYQLNVINTSTGVETDFWEFNDRGTGTGSTNAVSGGGTLSTGYLGQCSTAAFANAGNTCRYAGGTATGLPFSPNQLDPVELLQQHIPHDLQMLANCTSPRWIAPATFSDGRVGTQCPPEGEVLWIDISDEQIETLSIPRWAKTLYHNLHDYGWILENSGPPGTAPKNNPWLQAVSDDSWTLIGQPSQWTPMFNEIQAEGTSLNFNGGHANIPIPVPTGVSVSSFHWLMLFRQPMWRKPFAR